MNEASKQSVTKKSQLKPKIVHKAGKTGRIKECYSRPPSLVTYSIDEEGKVTQEWTKIKGEKLYCEGCQNTFTKDEMYHSAHLDEGNAQYEVYRCPVCAIQFVIGYR